MRGDEKSQYNQRVHLRRARGQEDSLAYAYCVGVVGGSAITGHIQSDRQHDPLFPHGHASR